MRRRKREPAILETLARLAYTIRVARKAWRGYQTVRPVVRIARVMWPAAVIIGLVVLVRRRAASPALEAPQSAAPAS